MGGKPKEPTVTQVPTKTSGQSQFLESLLGMMGGYMGGESAFGQMPTLGERYGGGRPAPGASMGASPGGKGGTTPGQGGSASGTLQGQGGTTPMSVEQLHGVAPEGTQQEQASMLTELLAGPIINPLTQGQTGNFPRRPMAGGR